MNAEMTQLQVHRLLMRRVGEFMSPAEASRFYFSPPYREAFQACWNGWPFLMIRLSDGGFKMVSKVVVLTLAADGSLKQ